MTRPFRQHALARLRRAAFVLAVASIFALAGTGLTRKITWYLAIDQFGYLTFAHDLASGRIFHRWPPIEALRGHLPPHQDFDVLSQTYVLHEGKLYCRYAPGFPLILAAWIRIFGSDGAHFLNPCIFLALMAVFLALGCRLLPGSPQWAALAALLLLLLFPTYLHLWAITLVRDLSAHLCAFGAILLLVSAQAGSGRCQTGRPLLRTGPTAAVGLLLGFATSIRPDAVLYLVSAAPLFLRLRPSARAAVVVSVCGFVGLSPLLAYNYLAVGNPFRPTQSMEIRRFLDPPPAAQKAGVSTASVEGPRRSAGREGGARRAQADGKRLKQRGPAPRRSRGYPPPPPEFRSTPPVQGGGLRLANLPHTLRGNVALLRQGYSDLFLGFAVLGALVSFVRNRVLFFATVPYSVLALLFFSCWVRPDPRYLAGVLIAMPLLVVRGVLAAASLPGTVADKVGPVAGRLLALAGAVAVASLACVAWPACHGRLVALCATCGRALAGAWAHPRLTLSALPVLIVLVPGVLALALLASVAAPRGGARPAAAALALALLGLAVSRSVAGWGRHARFQRPQMLRARATFEAAVPAGATVITTDTVGRPAENIEYYTHAHALYLVDLKRWGVAPEVAAAELARADMPPFLLIPPSLPGRQRLLTRLRNRLTVERILLIPPQRAMDYFVAAPFHRGVWMELYRMALPRRQPPAGRRQAPR